MRELNVDMPTVAEPLPSGSGGSERAGGVYAVMKRADEEKSSEPRLYDHVGKTVGENIADSVSYPPHRQSVQHHRRTCLFLKNLAPDGGVVKRSAVAMNDGSGPARVFDCEEDAIAAKGKIVAGDNGCHPL